jgi:hypothetical protein
MPLPPRRLTRYLLGATLLIFATVLLFKTTDLARLWRELPVIKQKGDSILIQELESLESQFYSSKQQFGQGSDSQYTFNPAQPLAGQNYTRRIVVPKLKRENISWIDEELPGIPTAVYAVDDRDAALRPPKNKGNEVMVYLSYIIDHYDILADVNIFIHAHRWAWHNNDLFDSDTAQMIRHLSDARVLREGYMNLRCQWYPGCPAWLHPGAQEEDEEKKEEKHVAKAWGEIFPGKPRPETLAQPCCSQFAVSKDRIRAVPLAEYERLRQWVLRTSLGNNMSGRVFEYLWQYLFTGQHALCPEIHTCYCDGYGACFADEHDFQGWFKMRFELRQDEWELQSWLDNEGKYEEALKLGRARDAERIERAPEGRVKELKLGIWQRWLQLADWKDRALERGRDSRERARVAGRQWVEGDA